MLDHQIRCCALGHGKRGCPVFCIFLQILTLKYEMNAEKPTYQLQLEYLVYRKHEAKVRCLWTYSYYCLKAASFTDIWWNVSAVKKLYQMLVGIARSWVTGHTISFIETWCLCFANTCVGKEQVALSVELQLIILQTSTVSAVSKFGLRLC